MSSPRRNFTILIIALIVVAGGVALGVGLSKGKGGSPSTTGGSTGSTIVFAEAPGAAPNYIFPYLGCSFFSVATTTQFQELMYRPLYWFGLGSSSAYVPSLSLANSPQFSKGDTVITITTKGWKFADGQTVNAQSVLFFLNLYKADPSSYCGYNKGYGIPDQLNSVTGSGDTVTLTFKSSVNPNWILYNYLSEITPLPDAWDVTAAGQSSTCATGAWGAASTDAACKAVEKYLDAQSAKVSTYTDSLWQSGDTGPWKLTAFDSLGDATFVPNTSYSGPVKPKVREVKELAFTSAQAEENQLEAGRITIGFVDPGVLTQPAPTPGAVGPNWAPLKSQYNLITGPLWDFNYAPFNFSSKDPKSAAVHQLYIRQALQEATDQTGVIKDVDKGYGFPSYSPLPPNTPTSLGVAPANPYPFSLSAAKALLTSHGWQIVGGVQTCERPGTASNECGAGITKGYTLNLSIVWASGTPALDQTFNAEIADWKSIGINFSHTTATFNNVIADCNSGAGYELCSWGGGWVYAPDYYPSGETLFTATGGFNPGSYSNAQMTSLVNTTTFGTASLTTYARYAAQQLPVLYQPQAYTPTEVLKTLKSSIGFQVNPLGNFMPEYFSY